MFQINVIIYLQGLTRKAVLVYNPREDSTTENVSLLAAISNHRDLQ